MPFRESIRRLMSDKVAVVSFVAILAYVLIALAVKAGVLYPDINIPDNAHPFGAASWTHPFGTDSFGRDILGRALHGSATALSIGLIASGIALAIGVTLGAVAGYFGGGIDMLVSWAYTTVDSIPYILLIPSLAFVMGRGLTTVYVAVGLTSWVTTCRLIRGEFLKHKDRDYVVAARALGASNSRRIFAHILPNVAHLAFVQFGLIFVSAIKIEVILSYLGLGVEPSKPSWGLMINDAILELQRPFWGNLTAATLFMFVLILAFNLFNDALRECLDPKQKNR